MKKFKDLKRDHGSLIFIDLRDHFGLTQLVIDQANTTLDLDKIAAIKLESVITIIGTVRARDKEAYNPNIHTGEIEVKIDELEIESAALQIPFQVNEKGENYPEELRHKYRTHNCNQLNKSDIDKKVKLSFIF